MANPTITYINFAYCELEDNAKIDIQLFSEEKTHYFMEKGSKITIKDHVLKFNKADFNK